MQKEAKLDNKRKRREGQKKNDKQAGWDSGGLGIQDWSFGVLHF